MCIKYTNGQMGLLFNVNRRKINNIPIYILFHIGMDIQMTFSKS